MNKKLIFLSLVFFIFFGCSTKKDAFVNRFYHSKVGWFNGVFNGNQELLKKLEEGKNSSTDEYYKILKIRPIKIEIKDNFDSEFGEITKPRNLKSDIKQFLKSGNTDEFSTLSSKEGLARVEEKAQNAIKQHSMKIKGVERNKLMPEAYLLLGKARFYNGEYLEALEAFNYVEKNLTHLRKKIIQENKNYLAEVNHALENHQQANEIYQELISQKLKKVNQKIVSISYAQFLIDEKKYPQAIEALDVTYSKNKTLRARSRFIQGQIYHILKDDENARIHFLNAYKKSNNSELAIQSLVALSELEIKDNPYFKEDEIKLNKALKNGMYESKKNEIYYALGQFYQKNNDSIKSEQNYLLGLKEKESNQNLRGMNYFSLAKIYFEKENYVKAGAYYDSASTKIQDPKYKENITFMNESIKEVIKNYYLVKKNDSILSIVSKTPQEKIQYYLDYIKNLKEKEEKLKLEKSKKEEKLNISSDYEGAFANTNVKKVDSKFYFYSQNAKNRGITDFKQIWGDRSLIDNWRTEQNSYSQNNTESKPTEQELLGKEDDKNSRRFDVDFYMEKLPTTQKEIDSLKIQRDNAELALGIDYYDVFNNNLLATKTLKHLLNSPVKEDETKLKTLYNLYKINEKTDLTVSNNYKDKILTEFADSKYAFKILNPLGNGTTPQVISQYEEIYLMYKAEDYEKCNTTIENKIPDLKNDRMLPKFLLLQAYCQGKLENKDESIAILTKISTNYDQTEEGKKAINILKNLPKKEIKKETTDENESLK